MRVMGAASEFGRVAKHVYTEPKFVAQVQWMHEHPNPVQQIFNQLGSQPLSKSDEDVRDWLEANADRRVTVEIHEMPDFDWWEPRHDQPWRRQAARDREAGF